MTSPCVLQLDDVVRRHAWVLLKKRSNVVRRWILDDRDYYCEVDWNAFVFDHKVSRFDVRPDGHTYSGDWGSIKTGARWVPLHTCDFENRTETKQCHTFRGTRQTTAWMAVDLTQTFTLSNTVDLDLTFPPQFLHHRVGRDPGFKVNKLKGGIFREVLDWQVNSQVEVMPSWKAHAQLLARQESHVIDMEIRTTFTVPSGAVPVYFKRRSNDTYAFEVKVDNIEDAFQTAEDHHTHDSTEKTAEGREEKETGGGEKPQPPRIVHTWMEKTLDSTPQGDSNNTTATAIAATTTTTTISRPQLVTRGTCVCVSWSDQKVDISTSPLRPLHPSSSSSADGGDVPANDSHDGFSSCLSADV